MKYDKEYDVIKIREWVCPGDTGVPLITMPNVPQPLHGINPRSLMGEAKWDELRMKLYLESRYKCEICGRALDDKSIQLHELYSYNRAKREAIFQKYIVVCKLCHNAIHSGRMLSFYKNQNLIFTKEYVLEVIENCFKLVGEYNVKNETVLRLYHTFLKFLYLADLEKEVRELIAKYNIKFYDWQGKLGDWRQWHLIWNGKKYYSPYLNSEHWRDAMWIHNSSGDDRLRKLNQGRRPREGDENVVTEVVDERKSLSTEEE